jgi:hypothetical protein
MKKWVPDPLASNITYTISPTNNITYAGISGKNRKNSFSRKQSISVLPALVGNHVFPISPLVQLKEDRSCEKASEVNLCAVFLQNHRKRFSQFPNTFSSFPAILSTSRIFPPSSHGKDPAEALRLPGFHANAHIW